MLQQLANLAVQLVTALLPELIRIARESKTEAEARRKIMIRLKRRAIETAYDAAAKELGR